MEDFLKKNGCKSIFALAAEAAKQNIELDVKSVQYLAGKLVHFMDYREAMGIKVDAQQMADSLIRLMPCIEKLTHYFYKEIHANICLIDLTRTHSMDRKKEFFSISYYIAGISPKRRT